MITADAKCVVNGPKLNEVIDAINPLLGMDIIVGNVSQPEIKYSSDAIQIVIPPGGGGSTNEQLDIVDANNTAAQRWFLTTLQEGSGGGGGDSGGDGGSTTHPHPSGSRPLGFQDAHRKDTSRWHLVLRLLGAIDREARSQRIHTVADRCDV